MWSSHSQPCFLQRVLGAPWAVGGWPAIWWCLHSSRANSIWQSQQQDTSNLISCLQGWYFDHHWKLCVLPTDHQYKWHVIYWPPLNWFSWGSPCPKNYFKGFSGAKRLRKAGVEVRTLWQKRSCFKANSTFYSWFNVTAIFREIWCIPTPPTPKWLPVILSKFWTSSPLRLLSLHSHSQISLNGERDYKTHLPPQGPSGTHKRYTLQPQNCRSGPWYGPVAAGTRALHPWPTEHSCNQGSSKCC